MTNPENVGEKVSDTLTEEDIGTFVNRKYAETEVLVLPDQWEKEFDEKFEGYLVMTDGQKELYKPREAIKDFIRTLVDKKSKEMYTLGYEKGLRKGVSPGMEGEK